MKYCFPPAKQICTADSNSSTAKNIWKRFLVRFIAVLYAIGFCAACSLLHLWFRRKTQIADQFFRLVLASRDNRERNNISLLDHRQRALTHGQLAAIFAEVAADKL